MTITLNLSEDVIASLSIEAAEQDLSLEAHIQALLTEWHTFKLPASDDEAHALLNVPPVGCPVL